MMGIAIGRTDMVRNEECSLQRSDATMTYSLPHIDFRIS
jgi:hypothetical protein